MTPTDAVRAGNLPLVHGIATVYPWLSFFPAILSLLGLFYSVTCWARGGELAGPQCSCSLHLLSWCQKATSLQALATLSETHQCGPTLGGTPFQGGKNNIIFFSPPPRPRISCPEAHFSCRGAEWGSEESVTGLHQTDRTVFRFATSSSIQRDSLQGQVSPTAPFCFWLPNIMSGA